ncbi:MAG TPA: type II toxin-antitoxin system VapC family toxin [Candidatus Acidoferrum sp.]|jgi:predicted nucleic acid-binding protein|nr:type II toxin-antitoxin system VapC family toxin [Candidatus Acidoferrum sp.]
MIYADTSFLLATRVRRDTFHRSALDFYEEHQEEIWLWCPWHRVEVFNSIRQLVRHPDVARRLSLSEAKALIHRLETDVRLGHFTHLEADWRDVLRTANETSIAHAFDYSSRAPDLLHVAYAKELAAELFVTFDEDQWRLAEASGLKAVRPG